MPDRQPLSVKRNSLAIPKLGDEMDENENSKPGTSSLEAQLHELNVRSHQYTNRLWQLPFAYAAVAALALTIDGASEGLTAVVSLTLGVIGVGVVLHIACGLADGVKRAVKDIQEIEGKLGLKQTAQWKPGWYVYPMSGIVILIALAEIFYAGWLLR